jgi:hypothetical protein
MFIKIPRYAFCVFRCTQLADCEEKMMEKEAPLIHREWLTLPIQSLSNTPLPGNRRTTHNFSQHLLLVLSLTDHLCHLWGCTKIPGQGSLPGPTSSCQLEMMLLPPSCSSPDQAQFLPAPSPACCTSTSNSPVFAVAPNSRLRVSFPSCVPLLA